MKKVVALFGVECPPGFEIASKSYYIAVTMSLVAYVLDGMQAVDHLAIETILLESLPPDSETILLFYTNSPCVIIGRNQNPWREVNADSSLPLFRRTSGGGTVYHDEGNLNWALIVPRSTHNQTAELELISRSLSACGFDIQPGERGGLYVGGTSKFAGRKVSGTARRFGSRRVIHHGTLLVQADLTALRASLGGLATFDDNSLPSVKGSPVNLADVRPDAGIESIIEGMAYYLSGKAPAKLPEGMVDAAEFDKTRQLLGSAAWIFGSTPPFSVRLGSAVHSVDLRVEKGRVAGVSGNHGYDWLAAISGEPFSFSLASAVTRRMAGLKAALKEGL